MAALGKPSLKVSEHSVTAVHAVLITNSQGTATISGTFITNSKQPFPVLQSQQ
jgi:hypothetical protein